MKSITIPLDIPYDLFITLNESILDLKTHFQTSIAIMLFKEGKVTIGKATQLSGLSRFEFEKMLAKNKIPISQISYDEILSDIDKLKDL